MKIAFVNDSFLKGQGVDTVIYELAKRLGKKHNITVVCGISNIKEENFKIKELGLTKLATGSFADFLGFKKLKKFRNECKGYDIISLHHSTLASAFLGITNTIVTCHGSPKILETEKDLIRVVFRFAANLFNVLVLRYNKKVVAISNYIKNDLIKKLVPRQKICVINNGVSKDFIPTFKDKGYMLFVGRHEKHKRINELIKLSKELGFLLCIAGSGPETRKLKEYTRKIEADKVKFLGKVSRKELIKLYQECSFFVSASRWEGFGLIFLEAAACSKPSIAYNTCSIPEVINNNETGFLVKNYNEFKAYARILIKSKQLRKKLGKEALTFSKKFDWNGIVKKYGDLFENLKEHKTKK